MEGFIMKKKILAIFLVVAMVAALAVGLTACKKDDGGKKDTKVTSFEPIAKENIKFGLITLHGEESTYDKNFIDAARKAIKNAGLSDNQLIIKTGVPEGDECYDAAAELVGKGCNIIFADSFGHEPYVLKAAKEFPNVRFCHATGTTAHTELQPNFYNAFASIYEGRYLAGIAAGMKLNEMAGGKATGAAAVMGYVGAYTYAEVISGYTSFYLGAKSVCPDVKMKVKFTGSWYDQKKEGDAADALIAAGCKLISQHADSMGAPTACKNANVPNVTYNISTKDKNCENSYLIGSKINWAPYYEYVIACTINGVTALGFDWTGDLATGSVELLEINDAVAAAGTKEAIEAAIKGLENGTIQVFDLEKDNYITVDGKKLTNYKADVDTDDKFTPDTFVVVNGTFNESTYRSAPYFDIKIDGIELLNTAF